MAKRRRKKKKKWIKKARSSMKRRGTVGSFTRWCRTHGFSGATRACDAAGKRSRSAAVRKKANFSSNVKKRRKKKK